MCKRSDQKQNSPSLFLRGIIDTAKIKSDTFRHITSVQNIVCAELTPGL